MADSLDTTLKKVKNSGYFFVVVMAANAAMMWQSNKDFTESQRAINVQTAATVERLETAINELRTANAQHSAIEAAAERRLQMLENRQK